MAKVSVQKVGAVLRKAGFERSRWLKSGRVKGWGHSTAGYRVKLHWSGYVEVSNYEGDWARGSDEEREARHMDRLRDMAAALAAAGLHAEAHSGGYGWPELRVCAQAGVTRMGGDAEGGSVAEGHSTRSPTAMRPAPSSTVIEGQQ